MVETDTYETNCNETTTETTEVKQRKPTHVPNRAKTLEVKLQANGLPASNVRVLLCRQSQSYPIFTWTLHNYINVRQEVAYIPSRSDSFFVLNINLFFSFSLTLVIQHIPATWTWKDVTWKNIFFFGYLHIASLHALYLVLTLQVQITTIFFGKLRFMYLCIFRFYLFIKETYFKPYFFLSTN